MVSVRFVFFSHDAVSLSLSHPSFLRSVAFFTVFGVTHLGAKKSLQRARAHEVQSYLDGVDVARGSRARSARIITPFLLFRSVSPCCTFTVVVTFSSGLLSYDVCNGCRRRQECLNEPGVSPEKFSVSLRLHRTSYVNGLFPFFAPLSAVSLLF